MERDTESLDGGRKDRLGAENGLKTTSGTVVRDTLGSSVGDKQRRRDRQTDAQLPRMPSKDTQQGKGGEGKTTVKVQLSGKQGRQFSHRLRH